MQMNKLAELLSKEGGSNIADITKLMDAALTEAETEEATEEKAEEASEEKAEEAEEKAEETTEEEGSEEAAEEETKEEAADEPAEDTGFTAVLAQLADELKALREENASLREKLAAKETAEADFVKKFKKLSVSLGTTPKDPVAEHKEVYTDGIGE